MAEAKLNQLLAIEKGVKKQVYDTITQLNNLAQKPHFFDGFSKTYQKLDENDADLPSETKKVQLHYVAMEETIAASLVELFDITARKDWSNLHAVADVKLEDGTILAPSVPATHLLFLEKQLADLNTLVGNIPTLDIAEDWSRDPNATGIHRTGETKTHRTKKVPEILVKYPATDKHPAQTEVFTTDKVVGYWHQTKFSGAMPEPRKKQLLRRIDQLIRAVKQAREEANSIAETETPKVGEALLAFVFKE